LRAVAPLLTEQEHQSTPIAARPQVNCVLRQVDAIDPDKVIGRPYLGREAVSFSSILHDDLQGRTAAAG
jgi:hypothetical protein